MRLIIKYLLLTLVLLVTTILSAQNRSNPFELKDRLEVEATNASKKEEVDTRIIQSDNPFDIATQPIQKTTTLPVSPTVSTDKDNTTLNTAVSKNHLFWVFFLVLAFFTTVVSISRKRLEQSYRAFLNDNFLRQLHRVNQGSFSFSYFLLYLSFFLNAGIFIYLTANYFGANLSQNFGWVFLVCLGVALAFLFKHILLFFIQSVFPDW